MAARSTRSLARAERAAHATALLTELPAEIGAHLILSRLDTAGLCRLACTCKRIHSLVESALRVRAAEAGAWAPTTLPPDEASFLPLLLRRDRRRTEPRQPISCGSWHSLCVDAKGQLYSCGVERAVGPDRRGLLGHGVMGDPAGGMPHPAPIKSMSGVRIRSVREHPSAMNLHVDYRPSSGPAPGHGRVGGGGIALIHM